MGYDENEARHAGLLPVNCTPEQRARRRYEGLRAQQDVGFVRRDVWRQIRGER